MPAERIARLDLFLVTELQPLSRRRGRQWIERGLVRVNGSRAAAGSLVRPADVVTVEASLTDEHTRLVAEPELDVAILHEDADLVAIDKPPGMPSLALLGDDRGTVGNFLIARYPELRGLGPRLECGIVHRLDPGTSGILLAARNTAAHESLRSQFRSHSVEKEYVAWVSGDLFAPGSVQCPIAHAPRSRRRMIACADRTRARALRARAALTRYRPLCRYGWATLVGVATSTGVRHQIRVHMASIGHPILGDPVYGGDEANRAGRLMLHASRVRFRHPTQGRMVVTARVPSTFASATFAPLSERPRT